MDIYLAARYSRHKELQEYAKKLQSMGYRITSRWIWGDHQIDDQGLSSQAKESERIRFATEDLEDLINADICISFTEKPRASNSRGGRHVEYGIALALKKRHIVVGHRENIFHCLPTVEFVETFEDCISFLLTPPKEDK